jgi:prevent-host-death family protein
MLRPKNSPSHERFSVSQTKTRLSEVLRRARDGHAVIITDHGQDIAQVTAIAPAYALHLIHPTQSFDKVRNIRAPELQLQASALDLLLEDRARR